MDTAAPIPLRQAALSALCETDPQAKCSAVQGLWAARARWQIEPLSEALLEQARTRVPGRPARPRLLDPSEVPHRSPFTPAGRAALTHAIAHIEFNAINLALDAVWRFEGLGPEFHRDWMQVAHEESRHFGMLAQRLAAMGHAYGDFDAHDGLWIMCERTAHDLTARMALVPRTLEARGLDATPLIQARLRQDASEDARALCAVLDVILREEVGHVAIGNRWYRHLCEAQGLDPLVHFPALVERYRAPRALSLIHI